MNKCLLLVYIASGFSSWLLSSDKDLSFPQEFIKAYDLSKRDTHEYNPYMLKKTGESLLHLEQSLKSAGFSVEGRFGIFGYQEEAIPPYTTDWEREAIVDEVIVSTRAGFSQPTKNIFGYISGFLLKDAEWLQRYWDKKHEPQILHILARPISLFDDSSLVYQKHAFGKDYSMIIDSRDRIERALYQRDLKAVLAELVDFWQGMEERSTKTSSQEAVATQDMLFSIEYARALIEGQAPIKKFFAGPDITYPIEVLSCQKAEATVHAQAFIKQLDHNLTPINNQNTAFIFCSFVDGVGKSTLLNNIRNLGLYGDQFEKYERCDNSSSQEATLFKLKDQVFIVDLPAQLSHFVIKPDGHVYTDIQTVTELKEDQIQKVHEFVAQHKKKLIQAHKELATARSEKALYENTTPEEQYAQNCRFIKLSERNWIPFSFEDHHFLFDKNNHRSLKVLVPLAQAHSTGLKVAEPEQMLFMNGLSLPMSYRSFIANLINKLQKADVKNIIFVDFLSMYPRSSRENIRLNFVLQYVRKIFSESYQLPYSFYQYRVHDAQEICHLLTYSLDKAAEMLVLEAVLRWALDLILEKNFSDKVSAFKGQLLEDELVALTSALLKEHSAELYRYAYERLESEQANYHKAYHLDRIYQTIILFSPLPLLEFSSLLSRLFTGQTNSAYLSTLWTGLDNSIAYIPKNGSMPLQTILDNGTAIDLLSGMYSSCREEVPFREFARKVRAQWYATLSNLLSTSAQDGFYEFIKIEQPTPPLVIKQTEDMMLYSVQKQIPLINTKQMKLALPTKFNIFNRGSRSCRWGVFDKLAHCLDWDPSNTYTGVYGYGYQSIGQKTQITKAVEIYRQICASIGCSNLAMPIAILYKMIMGSPEISENIQKELKNKKCETIKADDPRRAGLQLWARMIATLDMIIKDPDARIIVRKGDKEDFAIALRLLETITLPYYYGLKCETPLFEEYSAVEPVISWESINAI